MFCLCPYKKFEGVLKSVVKSVDKEGAIQFQCFFHSSMSYVKIMFQKYAFYVTNIPRYFTAL